jgi:hypothetical protein
MFSTKLLTLRRGVIVAGVASLRIELGVGPIDRVIYVDGVGRWRCRESSSRSPGGGDNGWWLMRMTVDAIQSQSDQSDKKWWCG